MPDFVHDLCNLHWCLCIWRSKRLFTDWFWQIKSFSYWNCFWDHSWTGLELGPVASAGPWVDTWAWLLLGPWVCCYQILGSVPGQAELTLRLQYSGAGTGHRATSGCTVRTEVSGPDTRVIDWHLWVPRQAGLILDHGRVRTGVGSQAWFRICIWNQGQQASYQGHGWMQLLPGPLAVGVGCRTVSKKG